MIVFMIHLTTDTRLKIILPNTNKALDEAIKSATPEQLSTLKEGKDIKSLITSVFRDKITASKSDQTLIQILKHAPAFKNMGNFSEQLGSLATEFKTLPELTLKSGTVGNFLKSFDSLNGTALKSQLEHSGVFMESKIASALQVLPSLKETLETLRSLLSQSSRPDAKYLGTAVASLLNEPFFHNAPADPASARQLGSAVQKVTESLRALGPGIDVLYSKEVAQLADSIGKLPLSATSSQEIKASLSQLYGALLSSTSNQSNFLLDGIEQLLKADSILPEEVKTFSALLSSIMQKNDPVASALSLLPELGKFTDPALLELDSQLQQSLKDDLKSQLMGLSEELRNSAHPKTPELLESVDKLLSIIDYHQLVSYLNASNSIYFPFAWDMLEEGSMAFKKGKEKKFYCEINLRLKEYGELNLMMALYDENRLDIQAHTEKKELKECLMENMGQLRALLIDAGLVPQTIRISEMRETTPPEHEGYTAEKYGNDLGFEVKV